MAVFRDQITPYLDEALRINNYVYFICATQHFQRLGAENFRYGDLVDRTVIN